MTRNLMVSVLFTTAWLSAPLHAQFDNLVTTDDGSTILFQSQWRLAGSSDGNLSKVFRWDSNGFTTVFSPPDPGLLAPPSASDPVISGDGTITGYVSFPGCAGATCSTATYSPVLSGITLPAPLPATPLLQISRNGRYLASYTTLLDRTTGVTQIVGTYDPTTGGPLPVGGRFGISNNGGLLLLVLHQEFIVSTVDLVLSDQPGIKIVTAPDVNAAVVSAAENRVVYEVSNVMGQPGYQLWSFDVASGKATMLENFNFGTYLGASQYQPAISNDGVRLVYRRMNTTTQQWDAVVHDYAAGTTTVIGTMLPSQNNFSISGDGKSVWLHRIDGRLVQIAIDSLTATETKGRHAWIAQIEGAAVYGSYNHLFGGGFSTGSDSGLPSDLGVDLAGLPCPLLAAAAQELDIEIPWEAYLGNFTVALRNSSSPFESVQLMNVIGLAPTFERGGLPGDANRPIKLAHQDFRGPVSYTDPAVAGETVHLYMTGLGDVEPRPPDGQTSSSLAYAYQRPVCWLTSSFAPAQTPAPVLFAGIAPGMVGIYQVDVTIPASYPSSAATIGCFDEGNSEGLSGDYGTFPIVKSM